MIHDLKTWPREFEAVLAGLKKHEVRRDDRDFQIGDELRLREWRPENRAYTEREVLVRVTWKTVGGSWNVEPGFCVLSIEIVKP